VIAIGGAIVAAAVGALVYFSSSATPEPAAPPPATVAGTPAASPAATPKPPAARPPAATAPPPAASPTPQPTAGTLLVESDVPETSVFINRTYVGTAPVTAPDLKPGPHQLRLSAAGYDGIQETIEIVPGPQTFSAKFKEVRLNASAPVTHKHAIGSCSGTLRATPQGLTYDTTNKNDAFTVSLTGLETFTVDYLEKNLRVKIRGGKTYNFTDPDGKADRLYLFHGEVEKARQRLLSGK
jgi:hypothetical protein